MEFTLLRICIDNGQLAILELLLDSGADIGTNERLDGGLVGFGPPFFAANSSRHSMATRRKMVQLLIDHGADPQVSLGNHDAMSHAVKQADSQVGDLQREHGLAYGPHEMASSIGSTNCDRSSRRIQPFCANASVPSMQPPPGQGPTLLGSAIVKGNREMSVFLIEQGAPLDTVEGLGQTLLHLAARSADPELVRLLIARGADVDALDERNDTPLTDCIWNAPPQVISALIEAGANVNAQRSDGKTALHLAVSRTRPKIVQILLTSGADRRSSTRMAKQPPTSQTKRS
ncbi:MAG: hypothetical protein CMJ64_25880 [Planctomycetaceae bacterium]|nr:hypothetical protein [Planctomycetaceae bacterium]